ncbi:FliM/FliN family flagellar motor switch protein [Buchnera aphidicola]|uniref:Flagellar motor switch protein FliM n=1 Tax=Buchnera aphidicola str. Ua (Uroleucon ambrosiae) TaxID=1005057 RepID=G2LNW5_BUCUM|nr:FliM/FliN family flagellar motor switch protein [Buchnera aphidicola]AEO07902.1 flagellar motor switch protein FliM [Buchnera aphidicola str. Ua (Uroleucon ambrosiae)]
MGKSHNFNDQLKKVYQRDNNLHKFLQEDAIQIFENINDCFVNHFVDFFSHFIKNKIELIEYNFKIDSYNFQNIIKKNVKCYNLIEISPYQNKSFIIFYNNFLSVTLDFLFGGAGTFSTKIKNTQEITDTDLFINKKIITFITNFLSNIYQKNFCKEINFIDKKIFFNNTTHHIDLNMMFLINNFNFKINNIEFSFDILIPESIISKINVNKNMLINDDNNIHKKTNNFSLKDIENVELNIIARMISMKISKDKFHHLSVGDILPINQPDKIIGYIENQPIFFGNYKSFNKQSIIFIEKFINNDLELNQE